MNIHRFANPTSFNRLASTVLPWCTGLAIILFTIGFYFGLWNSPPDYLQGESVRIMYIHVPAAWLGLSIYASLGIAAICSIVWKHLLANIYIRAAAPIGALLTLLCLITGALWGKPTWGTWWVWDARLTSMLILFFLYLGIIALGQAFPHSDKGEKAAALLALIGCINLPIIKFSVEWWSTLHQPASVLRLDGPSIDPSMLKPLFIMALAYLFYFISLVLVRMRILLMQKRIENRVLQIHD